MVCFCTAGFCCCPNKEEDEIPEVGTARLSSLNGVQIGARHWYDSLIKPQLSTSPPQKASTLLPKIVNYASYMKLWPIPGLFFVIYICYEYMGHCYGAGDVYTRSGCHDWSGEWYWQVHAGFVIADILLVLVWVAATVFFVKLSFKLRHQPALYFSGLESSVTDGTNHTALHPGHPQCP